MQLFDPVQFYQLHKGETALLVGNGPNLHKTPPEWFDYPSFGLNTIHKYKGWRPTYYCACDYSLFESYGAEVVEAFPDIPKFIPSPNLDCWTGPNFYRFYHRPGNIIVGGKLANQPHAFTVGLGYQNVMHVAMQVAWYMGFTTLLMIGVEQKPRYGALMEHFWGTDENTPASQTDEHWNVGYREIVSCMTKVRVLNISEDTYVPADVLPRGDWREWRNVYESANA